MLKRQLLPDHDGNLSQSCVPAFLWKLLASIAAIVLAIPATHISPLYASVNDDIRILRSDADGVTLEYVPAPAIRDTVIMYGEQFDVLTIDGCTLSTRIGHPQIPSRKILLGLPPGAAPTVSVVESPSFDYARYRLAPTILPDMPADQPRLDPSAYSRSTFTPALVAEAGQTGTIRGLEILPVTLYPIRFNPAEQRIRTYQRLVIDVRFNAPTSSPAPERFNDGGHFGPILNGALLNGDVSASWHREPNRSTLTRPNTFGPGDWFKISISETGLHRLDHEALASAGLDPASVDPRNLRMYSGGGRILPTDVDVARPELRELAIQVNGETDGRFDESDYLLFYASSVNRWAYDQSLGSFAFIQNPYTNANIYWLNVGTSAGKRTVVRDGTTANVPSQSDSPRRVHVERELTNPLESGTEWFWQLFDGAFREEVTFPVTLANVTRGGQVSARFRLKSKTRFAHHVQVFINDQLVGERFWNGESVPIVITGSGAWLTDGENEIKIVVPRNSQSPTQPDHVYFDWFELTYWTDLATDGEELLIEQDPGSLSPLVRYQVSGAAADARIYDISDPFQVSEIGGAPGGAFLDSTRTGEPARYLVADPSHWRTPISVIRDAGSSLRATTNGADYIIVTHDDFVGTVDALKTHRQSHSGMNVYVAAVSDVYDEFSWGLVDPTAIRDFLQYTAQSWTSPQPPTFALLVGDGNYDYLNHSGSSKGLWIPAFEEGYRCTDDFFVYFDGNNDPATSNDIFPDMAIGRLPVQSISQAETVINKIITYESTPQFGTWRNTVILTSDDERTPGVSFEEPFHIGSTERLADREIPPSFLLEKVYLTEYTLDAAGEKPDARDALIGHINRGALLVNWVGHGAANLWAHERVFNTARDLPSIDNEGMLPLFVTATCTAGRFDLLNEEAMAEEFLRAEGKGAVAFVGATRLSFPSPNERLNRILYDGILNSRLPIGSALMQAKIGTVNRDNSEKYVLFGDPAMQLGHPRQDIQFGNGSTDTLKVAQVASVVGEVLKNGSIDQNFSGTASVRTFDSAREAVYVTPSGGQITYQLPGADVFRGPVPVDMGAFTASFIVPRDITYGGDQGRITVYATNNQSDASGALDLLPLRGAAPSFVDTTGPTIEILVDGRALADGDFSAGSPTLTINLSDASGINITGEVGHQITVQTDNDTRSREDVTNRFTYQTGSFKNGSLQYPVPELEPGDHPVTIRAWDNFNNTSTITIVLSVVEEADLRITDVMNYPNPFAGPTTFTFELTQDADVSINVYTVAGALIRSFPGLFGLRGFNQVDWDGRDHDGDTLANGGYLYKITAGTQIPERNAVSVFGRLLVVR